VTFCPPLNGWAGIGRCGKTEHAGGAPRLTGFCVRGSGQLEEKSARPLQSRAQTRPAARRVRRAGELGGRTRALARAGRDAPVSAGRLGAVPLSFVGEVGMGGSGGRGKERWPRKPKQKLEPMVVNQGRRSGGNRANRSRRGSRTGLGTGFPRENGRKSTKSIFSQERWHRRRKRAAEQDEEEAPRWKHPADFEGPEEGKEKKRGKESTGRFSRASGWREAGEARGGWGRRVFWPAGDEAGTAGGGGGGEARRRASVVNGGASQWRGRQGPSRYARGKAEGKAEWLVDWGVLCRKVPGEKEGYRSARPGTCLDMSGARDIHGARGPRPARAVGRGPGGWVLHGHHT